MSNAYDPMNNLEDDADLEILLKNEFPGFEVVKMDKPLRLPLNVTKFMKAQTVNRGQVSKLPFNAKLIKDCTLPSNMAEGSINAVGHFKLGISRLELFTGVLKQVFESEIAKHQSALIIIDDRPNSFNNAMRAKINCSCKNKINVLMVDYALQLIGRKRPKILTIHYCTSIQQIIEWILGNRVEDMIVSYDCMRGCEYDFIIDTTATIEASTRTLAHVIRTVSNPLLDMEFIIQTLLKPGHDCKTIMNWNCRPELTSNLSILIGNEY